MFFLKYSATNMILSNLSMDADEKHFLNSLLKNCLILTRVERNVCFKQKLKIPNLNYKYFGNVNDPILQHTDISSKISYQSRLFGLDLINLQYCTKTCYDQACKVLHHDT